MAARDAQIPPDAVRLAGRAIPYGWIVLATLSVTETVTWGIVYYGFPVFLRPMEEALGASRVAVTGALSLGLGVSALAAIPVGRWLDRHGGRAMMTAGSCLATALVLAWSRVDGLPALYAVWFLMGLAMAATLYEPAFAIVVSWFARDRARALLVLTLVAGLASTIFMPLEAWLLGRLGWRRALGVLAVVLGGVTIPLHALLLRRGPAIGGAARGAAASPAPGLTLREATRTTVFWVLAAAFLVGNFATVSLTTHLIPYLVGRGYPATIAAATVGWMGAMQLVGRGLFAPLAGRVGTRGMTAAVFLLQAAGVAHLPLLGRLVPTLVPFVVLAGAANGMATLARATSLADLFGARHYGAIGGAIGLAANGARAIGPLGASLLLVAAGSYDRVFSLIAGSLVVAGAGVLLAIPAAGAEDATGPVSR